MDRKQSSLILLIVAMALNWPVAWACVLWSSYRNHESPKLLSEGEFPEEISGPYGEKRWWFTHWGVGVWQSVPSGARGHEDGFSYFQGEYSPAYYRGGWPLYSLESRVSAVGGRAQWRLPVTEIYCRGLQTSWFPAWMPVQRERRLPLAVLLPGFIINAAAYFGVLIGLWKLRRRIVSSQPRTLCVPFVRTQST